MSSRCPPWRTPSPFYLFIENFIHSGSGFLPPGSEIRETKFSGSMILEARISDPRSGADWLTSSAESLLCYTQ
jgi:hypothetical protein